MAKSANAQWNGKSRGGRFGYQFFVYTIRLLGVRCAYIFLAFIVVYFIPFAPKATRAIWEYNRRQRGLSVLSSIKEPPDSIKNQISLQITRIIIP